MSIALIKKSDLYLGVNTGLLHIAAAFGKTCVTIYGVARDGSPFDMNGSIRYGAHGTVEYKLMPEESDINMIQPEQVIETLNHVINDGMEKELCVRKIKK